MKSSNNLTNLQYLEHVAVDAKITKTNATVKERQKMEKGTCEKFSRRAEPMLVIDQLA